MDIVAKMLGGIVGVFVLVILFKPIFGNREQFYGCLQYFLKPGLASWWDSESMDEWMSEMRLGMLAQIKLGIWLLLGVGTGIFTAIYLGKLFA